MLHTFDNTLLLVLCSGTSALNYRQKQHMNKILYFNHCDKFFDLNKTLREQLTEIQKNQPCELIKEAPEFRFNSVFGKRNI